MIGDLRPSLGAGELGDGLTSGGFIRYANKDGLQLRQLLGEDDQAGFRCFAAIR